MESEKSMKLEEAPTKIDYTIIACGTVGEPRRLAYKVGKKATEQGVNSLLIPLCDVGSQFVSERVKPIHEDSEILIFEDRENKKKGIMFKNHEGISFAGRKIDAVLVEEGSNFWVYWIPVTAAQETFEEAMRRAEMERKYIITALNRVQRFISKAIVLTTIGKTGPTRLSIVEDVIPNDLIDLRIFVGCKMRTPSPESPVEAKTENDEEDLEELEIVGIIDEDIVLPGGSESIVKTTTVSQSEMVANLLLKSTGNTILVNTSDSEDDILASAIALTLLPSTGHELKVIRRNKNLKALIYIHGAVTEKLALRQFDYLSIAELHEMDKKLLWKLIDHPSSFWCVSENHESVRKVGRKAVTKNGDGITVFFPIPTEVLLRIFPEHISEKLSRYCVSFTPKSSNVKILR